MTTIVFNPHYDRETERLKHYKFEGGELKGSDGRKLQQPNYETEVENYIFVHPEIQSTKTEEEREAAMVDLYYAVLTKEEYRQLLQGRINLDRKRVDKLLYGQVINFQILFRQQDTIQVVGQVCNCWVVED